MTCGVCISYCSIRTGIFAQIVFDKIETLLKIFQFLDKKKSNVSRIATYGINLLT